MAFACAGRKHLAKLHLLIPGHQPRGPHPIAAIVRLDVGGVLEAVVRLPPNSFVLDR
jgi:hypothetical protein